VIHENRGLNEWVRSVADQLAEAGFIAIAPDLLSGTAPNGGKMSDFPDQGAGHGFMRAGEEANATEANKRAREQAWGRWKALLKKI
jgi:dienelactone hydrolase